MGVRGIAAAAVAAALLLPATALGWGEIAMRAVPDGGPATCLRPAGGGGIVSLLGPLGRRTAPFDLLEASGNGLRPAGRAPFGIVESCASAAANDAGTAVVAGVEHRRRRAGDQARVRVTWRDRGGVLGSAVLQRTALVDIEPSVAVGPAGDAAVAWAAFSSRGGRVTLYLARRVPGRPFGAPRRIATWNDRAIGHDAGIALGIDAAGTTTIAWARPRPNRGNITDLSVVSATTLMRARPGFRAQRVGPEVQEASNLALAVTARGDALLAFAGNGLVNVFERRAERFVARRRFGGSYESLSEPSLAEAPDGSAVLAWRVGAPGPGAGGVRAVRRRGHAPFGRPQTLAPPPRDFGSSWILFSGFSHGRAFAPPDEEGGFVRAAIAPDGRAIVTWLARRTIGSARQVPAAYASSATPSRPFTRRAALASPCRPPNAVAPVVLRDGALGAVWTDTIGHRDFALETPISGGRVHLALAAARRRTAAPPPRASVRAPRRVKLGFRQKLRIRVRCNGACDLRAFVPSRSGPPRAEGMASLTRAGTAKIALRPSTVSHVVPRAGGLIQVAVHACARGSTRHTTLKAGVRAERKPVRPPPRPRGLSARRGGHRIVVRWQTTRPARRTVFVVDGLRRRFGEDTGVNTIVYGRGRRSFRAVLRARPRARIRWVRVMAVSLANPQSSRLAYARVR